MQKEQIRKALDTVGPYTPQYAPKPPEFVQFQFWSMIPLEHLQTVPTEQDAIRLVLGQFQQHGPESLVPVALVGITDTDDWVLYADGGQMIRYCLNKLQPPQANITA